MSLRGHLLCLVTQPVYLSFELRPGITPTRAPVTPSGLVLFSVGPSVAPTMGVPHVTPPSVAGPGFPVEATFQLFLSLVILVTLVTLFGVLLRLFHGRGRCHGLAGVFL